MQISMYNASAPRLVNILGNLSRILEKAEAHVAAKKLDEAALTGYRLYPDMFPFTRQVQIACDAAKGVVARLAGLEIPTHADDDKTLADLRARISKTIAFIQSVKPEQLQGSEDRTVIVKRPDGEVRFTGLQFLLGNALPNFYFHTTTAYDILRHNGVELGKRDFIGNPLI